MSDFADFLPLYPDQTEDVVRARWDAWANDGITIDDVENWTDTRVGGMFHMVTQPGVMDAARRYDLVGTEVVAAAFPQWSWGDYLDYHAVAADLERTVATKADGIVTFTAPEGTLLAAGLVVGVEPTEPGEDTPEYVVTDGGTVGVGGEIDLPVQATETGTRFNVSAHAVTQMITPGTGVTDVDNDDILTGGTETETDPALKQRILDSYKGRGAGTVSDYEQWALQEAGVGRVAVLPLWNGPGTVKVVPMTIDGAPVSSDTVTALQNRLDPVAGQGRGLAPVGAVVTVETAIALEVVISGTVEFEAGYSLDGSGGTVALEDALKGEVERYVALVGPGEEVVKRAIIQRLMAVAGVHDVVDVKIEDAGMNGNLTIDDDPPASPYATVTLEEGTI